MAEQVDTPGVGKIPKQWLYIGVAIVGGVLAYAWWHNRQSTVEPINPDALPEDRIPPDTVEVGTQASESAGRPLTNAEWAQTATDRMLELGYDTVLVSSALGKYLQREPLTGDEASLIRTALGQIGPPPDGDFPVLLAPTSTAGTGGDATSRVTTWIGHRLSANTTWGSLAEQYAVSKTATGIYSTKKALIFHNPTLAARVGTKDNAVLKSGWIVLIPTHS